MLILCSYVFELQPTDFATSVSVTSMNSLGSSWPDALLSGLFQGCVHAQMCYYQDSSRDALMARCIIIRSVPGMRSWTDALLSGLFQGYVHGQMHYYQDRDIHKYLYIRELLLSYYNDVYNNNNSHINYDKNAMLFLKRLLIKNNFKHLFTIIP